MQAAILSALRYVIVSVGSVYAAKHGIDQATVESLASAALALGTAAWGVYLRIAGK